ncbi:helix-turn-helix domain-containing protein [Streptomyces sp. S3(2020)]|uniref:helix-turn-helix transcriptional regulator n=1 Tax=Streptomyces sp. S3(2020) TaxID=2732044 RepID=UPI0014879206|nr:helix-turn-helix domain-containing protein [Streptomyces sp. S3(2020)]NNN36124.1 helix-turn-helix domain-containing protein [Streptomyces sp. S3(2020)]
MSDVITPCDEEWLTPSETAEVVNVAKQTLANWRALGTGPSYSKLSKGRGGRIRYRRHDVLAWLAERKVAA